MKWIYKLCGISKQAHSKALKRLAQIEDKTDYYVGFILQTRVFHPGMGLRRLYEQFNPEGIGRDQFIALGLAEGLRLRKVHNAIKTTRSVKNKRYSNLLAGKRFTAVNQVWVSDIFYFSVNGVHQYVVLIMDAYSRRIIGYSAADNMRAINNIKALQMALDLRNIANYLLQLIHHSDRGSQYISDDYTSLLDDYGIEISMCSNVLENAHMERVNGTIKNDYLARWEIKDAKDLPKWLKKAVDGYNNRIHDSLKCKGVSKKMTPIEFEMYIKNIPINERPVLEFFTYEKPKVNLEDHGQLSLFKQY